MNRTLSLIDKHFDGRVLPMEQLGLEEHEAMARFKSAKEQIGIHFDAIHLRQAYRSILDLASEGNMHLSRTEPWKKIKAGDLKGAHKTLSMAAHLCKELATCAAPILPQSMDVLWKSLHLSGCVHDLGAWDCDVSVESVEKPALLYPKVDDSALDALADHFANKPSLESLVPR